MMCEIPLTLEQQIFAANHHDIVYKFLQKNRLSEDTFYDVIIFGYLRAVRRFLNETNLQHYEFTTIAWNCMKVDLINHLKAQKRKQRDTEMLSLHMGLFNDDLPLEETITDPDNLLHQLETELILHDLAKRVSKQQMDIVRMKSSGYNLQDIAQRQNMTQKRVQKLLEEVRGVLMEICCE